MLTEIKLESKQDMYAFGYRIQIRVGKIEGAGQIDPALGGVIGHWVILPSLGFSARIRRKRTQRVEEWPRGKP